MQWCTPMICAMLHSYDFCNVALLWFMQCCTPMVYAMVHSYGLCNVTLLWFMQWCTPCTSTRPRTPACSCCRASVHTSASSHTGTPPQSLVHKRFLEHFCTLSVLFVLERFGRLVLALFCIAVLAPDCTPHEEH